MMISTILQVLTTTEQLSINEKIWIALAATVSILFGLGLKLLYKLSSRQELHGEILSLMSMSNISKIELFEVLISRHCRHYPDDMDVLQPLLTSLKGVNTRVANKLDSQSGVVGTNSSG